MNVFILYSGSGSDGDEYYVEGVFSTEEKAEAKAKELKLPDHDKRIDQLVLDA